MDIFKFVLNCFHNYYQKLLVNLESLSLTMLSGIPCFATISENIISAIFSAPAGSLVGINLAILLNLSMTTRTPLLLFLLTGRSVRKSMAISCQGPAGVGNGYNNPAGFSEDFLIR